MRRVQPVPVTLRQPGSEPSLASGCSAPGLASRLGPAQSSLSTIVPVAVARYSVAPTGLASVTVKVSSSGSRIRSPTIGTAIVLLVSPAAKTRVPEVAT